VLTPNHKSVQKHPLDPPPPPPDKFTSCITRKSDPLRDARDVRVYPLQHVLHTNCVRLRGAHTTVRCGCGVTAASSDMPTCRWANSSRLDIRTLKMTALEPSKHHEPLALDTPSYASRPCTSACARRTSDAKHTHNLGGGKGGKWPSNILYVSTVWEEATKFKCGK
jgi:hypothetical protein